MTFVLPRRARPALWIMLLALLINGACSSGKASDPSTLRSKISENGNGVAAVVQARAAEFGKEPLQPPVEAATRRHVDGIMTAVEADHDAHVQHMPRRSQ